MAGGNKTARAVAVDLIVKITDQGQAFSDLAQGPELAALDPSERARAQRLCHAVLRQMGKADAVLKPHLRRVPPEPVRAILRLATVEMLAEGAASHGVVNEAVKLVRAQGARMESYAGLVNAVLRKVAQVDPAAWAGGAAQPLPNWLRGRLMSAWGKKDVMAMEAAHAAGAALDLTPKDGDAGALAAALGGVALPTGSVRLAARGQVSELPGFAEGAWWVQDAAAALAARALAAATGRAGAGHLCRPRRQDAATGRKRGAQVTALDISGPRAERISENLARCGLSAQVVVADALHWQADAPFDAVLLDAPCSATGTIRRHPDLPYAKDGAAIRDLVALQAALADRAVATDPPRRAAGGLHLFAVARRGRGAGRGPAGPPSRSDRRPSRAATARCRSGLDRGAGAAAAAGLLARSGRDGRLFHRGFPQGG